ncbi:endonuclease/exonuclease/phosphatase family protein [uncultured Jatrophihabitans sp.]|uniref:endonuclease/exonuclease/phosphatase family protein n=1 Tax=uncultured Jatrophihabitans sp. TaxID=1610747 RepID=UPI0035CA22F6
MRRVWPERSGWLRLRRDGEPWRRVVSTVVAFVAVVVALAALLARQVAFDWQPLIVLAAFSHQLMWAAGVGLVAVLARRWLLAVVAVVCCTLVLLIQLPPVLRSPPSTTGRPLVVLQANLKIGSADAGAVVRLVRQHRVDLLATEELTTAEQSRLLAAGLGGLLAHRYTAPLRDGGGGGLGIWSRYPVSAGRNLPGYELGVLAVRVALPAGPTTFVAVHLLPPYPYPAGTWTSEITRLRGFLRGLTGPVVVSGDFNATVDHARFRALLGDGYADATSRAGEGYTATYPTDRWFPPLIAIDHVLARSVGVVSTQTVALPGSDHRGLLVELRR